MIMRDKVQAICDTGPTHHKELCILIGFLGTSGASPLAAEATGVIESSDSPAACADHWMAHRTCNGPTHLSDKIYINLTTAASE